MTLLTPKYDYQPLTRNPVDGKRMYLLPNGEHVPSVTTILDATKTDKSKQALNNWRNRVGHKAAQEITTEAANRGTRMHSYLEYYIKNGSMKERGSNPFSWPSYTMAEEVIKQGLSKIDEIWGVEVPLYFPGIYAGTSDCIGIHKQIPAILDFKQTNKPKKEEWIDDYKLQLAAYAEAHNEIHGTKINKGVILMCANPETDELGQPKIPVYQEFVVEGEKFEYWRSEWWKRVEQYYTNAK